MRCKKLSLTDEQDWFRHYCHRNHKRLSRKKSDAENTLRKRERWEILRFEDGLDNAKEMAKWVDFARHFCPLSLPLFENDEKGKRIQDLNGRNFSLNSLRSRLNCEHIKTNGTECSNFLLLFLDMRENDRKKRVKEREKERKEWTMTKGHIFYARLALFTFATYKTNSQFVFAFTRLAFRIKAIKFSQKIEAIMRWMANKKVKSFQGPRKDTEETRDRGGWRGEEKLAAKTSR